LFPSAAKRYGLRPKRHINTAVLLFLLFVIGCFLILSPTHSDAQGSQSGWGSDRWWDWSDYRGSLGVRFWIPKLASGSITTIGREHDLLGGYNFIPNPDYFKEMWFTLYIDRLALRFNFQEDHKFNGMIGTGAFTPSEVAPVPYTDPHVDTRPIPDPQRFSELDVGWTRFGLDLDLVRYPFLRAGINFDRHYEAPIFVNRQDIENLTGKALDYYFDDSSGLSYWVYLAFYDGHVQKFTTGQPPVTVGIHATAIPGRVRGIPLTAQARIRIPMPLIKQLIQNKSEARVTEWEVSAGLRPAVWSTSLYGFSTFSMSLEAGFRSSYLDMTPDHGQWAVKAHWQGVFVQVGLYY
jgi:hypothetical protein